MARNASRQCAGGAGIHPVAGGRHDKENGAGLDGEAEDDAARAMRASSNREAGSVLNELSGSVTILPRTRFTAMMEARDNQQFMCTGKVDYRIRKAAQNDVSKFFLDAGISQGIAKRLGYCNIHRTSKFESKTRKALFVPRLGLQEFGLCLRSKIDFHQDECWNSFSRTCSQGILVEGSV